MVATVERYERDLERLTPPGDPSDFVMIERPVFKEHTTRTGDKIDAAALRKICRNCNKRITETGDFAPLVIGHTDDDRQNEPEVVGFVGPFRMGRIGKEKPVAAIYARQWVRKDRADALKRYPRLSVEYWADKSDPTNGHFDPVSLLGAETPELDLGIHYQRDASGKVLMRYRRVVRYQAAMPGGGPNTALPGMVSGDKEKTEYSKEGAMNPEQMNQIVEALRPIIEQIVMNAMAPEPLEGEPETAPPPVESTAPPMDAPPPADDAMPDAPPAEPDGDEADKKAMMYRRERDDYRAKYAREASEHRKTLEALKEAEEEVEKARGEQMRASRYSRLNELRAEGYAVDPDEEYASTSEMTVDQFEKHVERIQTKYQRLPLGVQIPVEKSKTYTGHTEQETRARYARQAVEEVSRLRKRGDNPDYGEVLENITKNQGKYVPAE